MENNALITPTSFFFTCFVVLASENESVNKERGGKERGKKIRVRGKLSMGIEM